MLPSTTFEKQPTPLLQDKDQTVSENNDQDAFLIPKHTKSFDSHKDILSGNH